MEIILQEAVENLGEVGDVVKVKDGYARNYLLPRGFAVVADRRNRRVLEHQNAWSPPNVPVHRNSPTCCATACPGLVLTITARAGEEQKLFGSVTNIDIERALSAQGVTVDRRKILLDEPIKQLGTYTVPVRLNGGTQADLTVQVGPESTD